MPREQEKKRKSPWNTLKKRSHLEEVPAKETKRATREGRESLEIVLEAK